MSTSNDIVIEGARDDGGKKLLIAMVGIGLICALLIVLTYEGTRERISNLQAIALQEAIFRVVPGISSTVAYQMDQNGELSLATKPDPTRPQIFAGYNEQEKLVGFAIEASGQGYAGVIRILYGYDPFDEAIIGFYVLESKETPGLGDKIEKDPRFLENFNQLDVALNPAGEGLKNDVTTVKSGTKENPWEIDGITGATISSRAIGDIVNKSASVILPKLQDQLDQFSTKTTSK